MKASVTLCLVVSGALFFGQALAFGSKEKRDDKQQESRQQSQSNQSPEQDIIQGIREAPVAHPAAEAEKQRNMDEATRSNSGSRSSSDDN